MRIAIPKLILILSLIASMIPAAFAEPNVRVMVLGFQLNDLTDLPNAPEELSRIEYLSSTFKLSLVDKGVDVMPVPDQLKAEVSKNSATYLLDRPDYAAKLAESSGAKT